jgi:formate dehydrogenase subunit delta
MNSDYLVNMINQIAKNFSYVDEKEKAAGLVAEHITKFWEPRMKQQLVACIEQGGHGMSDVSLMAAKLV